MKVKGEKRRFIHEIEDLVAFSLLCYRECCGVMAQVGLLEDNVRIARLCATMLQYAGHQVTVYEHPRDCLNALVPSVAAHTSGLVSVSSLPLPVDVLILDLHLPDINGMDVLNCLLAHPRTQALPLIFFTAATRHEIAHALKLAPHATFVEKPFTFNELTVAITDVLASSAK